MQPKPRRTQPSGAMGRRARARYGLICRSPKQRGHSAARRDQTKPTTETPRTQRGVAPTQRQTVTTETLRTRRKVVFSRTGSLRALGVSVVSGSSRQLPEPSCPAKTLVAGNRQSVYHRDTEDTERTGFLKSAFLRVLSVSVVRVCPLVAASPRCGDRLSPPGH